MEDKKTPLKFNRKTGLIFGLLHIIFFFSFALGILGFRLGWFAGLTTGLSFGSIVGVIMGMVDGTLRE